VRFRLAPGYDRILTVIQLRKLAKIFICAQSARRTNQISLAVNYRRTGGISLRPGCTSIKSA
jgi:hypothetical protein